MKSISEVIYTHYSYATQQVVFSMKKIEPILNRWNQGYWALSPRNYQYPYIFKTLEKLDKKLKGDIMLTIQGVPSYK